jgi:hypothetical protein
MAAKVNRHVGLGAAVRLHVDVFRAKNPECAIDRELLDYIDIFATTVPAFPRVTFGVLIR